MNKVKILKTLVVIAIYSFICSPAFLPDSLFFVNYHPNTPTTFAVFWYNLVILPLIFYGGFALVSDIFNRFLNK